MTVKLYDLKPYDRTFKATVQTCTNAGRSDAVLFAVTLDQTLFFPEEGGQSCDTGLLTPQLSNANKPTISVIDVQLKGDEIVHYCDRPIEPGSAVTGKIDWAHRFDNMQQHTGEHIISGLVNKHFGFNNVGFHLSNETVTMDYDHELTPEQINRLEMLANEAIWNNCPVTAWYPSPDELASLSYRSKIDLDAGVRLVRIDGVDLCACCAPHVSTTAQVGLLKITDYRRYKGGMRLWIKCGGRALADYRMLHDQAGALSEEFSSPRDALFEPVQKIKQDLESAKSELTKAHASLLQNRIKSIPDDKPHIILLEPEIDDTKALRDALNELAEKRGGYCAAFYGRQDQTWRYLCAGTGSDCRIWNEELKKAFPVRGGGREGMVQGSVEADEAALSAWFATLYTS